MTKVGSGDKDSLFGYTGHVWHGPSGLNLTLFRAYDPNLGRWISRDPIGEDGGLNLYNYVGNNPIDMFDLLGLAKNCPKEKTDCEKLVDRLYNDIKGKPASDELGNEWIKRAYEKYKKHDVTGFKPDLVASGQRSDVYRHVYSNAGAYLNGVSGWPRRIGHTLDDGWGSINPFSDERRRGEERASKAGNKAGIDVGEIADSALSDQAPINDTLKDSLRKVLCN